MPFRPLNFVDARRAVLVGIVVGAPRPVVTARGRAVTRLGSCWSLPSQSRSVKQLRGFGISVGRRARGHPGWTRAAGALSSLAWSKSRSAGTWFRRANAAREGNPSIEAALLPAVLTISNRSDRPPRRVEWCRRRFHWEGRPTGPVLPLARGWKKKPAQLDTANTRSFYDRAAVARVLRSYCSPTAFASSSRCRTSRSTTRTRRGGGCLATCRRVRGAARVRKRALARVRGDGRAGGGASSAARTLVSRKWRERASARHAARVR